MNSNKTDKAQLQGCYVWLMGNNTFITLCQQGLFTVVILSSKD